MNYLLSSFNNTKAVSLQDLRNKEEIISDVYDSKSQTFQNFSFAFFPYELAPYFIAKKKQKKLLSLLRGNPKILDRFVSYLIDKNLLSTFKWLERSLPVKIWSAEVYNQTLLAAETMDEDCLIRETLENNVNFLYNYETFILVVQDFAASPFCYPDTIFFLLSHEMERQVLSVTEFISIWNKIDDIIYSDETLLVYDSEEDFRDFLKSCRRYQQRLHLFALEFGHFAILPFLITEMGIYKTAFYAKINEQKKITPDILKNDNWQNFEIYIYSNCAPKSCLGITHEKICNFLFHNNNYHLLEKFITFYNHCWQKRQKSFSLPAKLCYTLAEICLRNGNYEMMVCILSHGVFTPKTRVPKREKGLTNMAFSNKDLVPHYEFLCAFFGTI